MPKTMETTSTVNNSNPTCTPLSAKTELNLQPLQEYFTEWITPEEFLEELHHIMINYVTASATSDSIELGTLGDDISSLNTLYNHVKQIKDSKI